MSQSTQAAVGGAALGAVRRSNRPIHNMACSRLSPHISGLAASEAHTEGRSGKPNKRQRRTASSCTQRTPAGLPPGMPGIAELMDGAMQQAAQAGRQGCDAGAAG